MCDKSDHSEVTSYAEVVKWLKIAVPFAIYPLNSCSAYAKSQIITIRYIFVLAAHTSFVTTCTGN